MFGTLINRLLMQLAVLIFVREEWQYWMKWHTIGFHSDEAAVGDNHIYFASVRLGLCRLGCVTVSDFNTKVCL